MATVIESYIDSFSVLDSAKRMELVGRLRVLSQTASDEVPDSDASKFLWAGATLFHDGVLTAWEEITTIEEHAVLLWSAISVLDVLLFKWARYFEIDSRVGKTSPDKRTEQAIKLKLALMKQLDDYLLKSGLDDLFEENDLVSGEWVRRDLIRDIDIPFDTRRAPDAVALSLVSTKAGEFDALWTKTIIHDFLAYVLYIDTNPLLEDKTRYGETSKCGVRSDVSEVATVDKQYQTGVRVTVAAGTYYVVLALVTLNGRVALSNEVRLVVS